MKRITLIREMQATSEYRNYIQQNAWKLQELEVSIKKYWTPEMLELEQKVTE